MRSFKFILLFILVLSLVFVFVSCNDDENEEVILEEELIEEEMDIPICGGWSKVSDGTITPELQKIFDDAIDGLVGSNYELIELVETQVVAGVNYKFLVDVSPVVPNPEVTKKYVIVFVDLEGNSELVNTYDAE